MNKQNHLKQDNAGIAPGDFFSFVFLLVGAIFFQVLPWWIGKILMIVFGIGMLLLAVFVK